MYHPADGDQFVLELGVVSLPWDGKSPRSLTRVQSSLFLRQEPPGHEVGLDPAQLELWPEAGRPYGSEGPDPKDGAPCIGGSWIRRRSRRRRLLLEEEDHG